jgi:protein-tyrosine-phosphatase
MTDHAEPHPHPTAVLFACSHNAVRSPMAEALARHMYGRSIYFASAGVRAGELDPFAVAALDDMGIDLSRHRPQSFEDLEDASFDVIVTLSPEAHHRALEFTRSLAVDVIYWPTIDPTAVEGSREQRLAAYEMVRDGLAQKLRAWLGWQPISAG